MNHIAIDPTRDFFNSLLGLCLDASITAAVIRGLYDWQQFKSGKMDISSAVDIYFIDKHTDMFKIKKAGSKRAFRVVDGPSKAKNIVPKPLRGNVVLLVTRDSAKVPLSWDIVC